MSGLPDPIEAEAVEVEPTQATGPSFAILSAGDLVRLVAELSGSADPLAELFDRGYVIARQVER